jgi:hypothetical protein
MKNLVESSTELGVILQLGLQGLRLSSYLTSTPTSHVKLLNDIRMRRNLWRKLLPSRVLGIRDIGGFYQLEDGLLVIAGTHDENLQELRFYDLWGPETLLGFEPRLIRPVPSYQIFDFICDPTQDLLILVCSTRYVIFLFSCISN